MPQWFLVVAAILSSIFVYALDNTIVADIVPVSYREAPLLIEVLLLIHSGNCERPGGS